MYDTIQYNTILLRMQNFTIDGYDLITKYRNLQGSLFQALR